MVSSSRWQALVLGIVVLTVMQVGQSSTVAAEQNILLWPAGAPDAKGDKPDDKPNLTVFVPPDDKANGTAIIVCPGGGYAHLSLDKEGKAVAQWLNTLDIVALVLDYRHAGKGYQFPAPLEDAQRAIRLVRTNAATWKVDPSRIGILGFSAGGHLASTVGTHFDQGNPQAEDPIERASCRPDFLILCYAVISLENNYTHMSSKKNLLGDNPDPELVKNLSNETQVTAETPPTFLFCTNADTSVPAENSVQFYLALRKAKVPAELHIYQQGPHGVGLAPNDPVLSTWKDRLADWLKIRGLLKPTDSAANERK
ncbi:MAG TPA: alpha/beta hydrolase [Pirellulales bacterium]|nr:alpha/beta hydrolase [Pirellulales bacterium]